MSRRGGSGGAGSGSSSSSSGSSSLAQDLSTRLSHQIDLVVASFSGPDSGSSTASTSEDEGEDYSNSVGDDTGDGDGVKIQQQQQEQQSEGVLALQSTLSKLRGSGTSLSLSKLKNHIDEVTRIEKDLAAAREKHGATRSSLKVTRAEERAAESAASQEQLVWLLNTHLAVRCWGATLQQLMEQAEAVKAEETYWQSVEGEDASGLLYLVQTTPLRVANALRVLLQRLRLIANSPRPPKSLISYRVVRQALPPSLLITSLFPHLTASAKGFDASHRASDDTVRTTSRKGPSRSTRSLLFLTFSPLLLTRQEVSQKRRKLKDLRHKLARSIGAFVKDAEAVQEVLQSSQFEQLEDLSALGRLAADRLVFSQRVLASTQSGAKEIDSSEADKIRAASPSDLLSGVQQIVGVSLTTSSSVFRASLQPLTRPRWLTRTWPWLVSTPLIGFYISRKIYNSRQSIKEYYELAVETVRGFFVDWVIDPTIKILETLRHGDNSLAIMGRESLKSDFDSLERMVADFAKDQKMKPEDIASVAAKVREGDMTVVLGAYEQDLKSPLKSAVTGTLVRTLLIQVQKVKVDVDLAMDGIEKMLKSQQLTFAFVGVAPSMVLLYLLSKLLPSFSRSKPSRSSQATRKQVWFTMRTIDRILTAALDDTSTDPQVLDDLNTGLLLIELSSLRDFAASSAFPTRDRGIKHAFLQDVRDLENGSKGLEAKIRVFDRLVRGYEAYVKL